MIRVWRQKYEVLEKLGRGGSGQVYKVRDLHLDKVWTMKEVISEGSAELQALKRLSHPRFPRIVDAFREGGRNFLIMDYIEGKTLEDVLRQGPLTQKETVEIAGQILEALLYLHELTPPLLYLDLKPSNIMLTPEGEVKLIDLGSAIRQGTGDRVSGTAGYSSPEQRYVGSGGRLRPSTDIFSLGMVMFVMVTGRTVALPLVEEDSRRGIRTGRYLPCIAPALEAVIEKCTRGNESRRYASLREVRKDLCQWEKRRWRSRLAGKGRQFWHQEKSVLCTAGKSCLEIGGKLCGVVLPLLLSLSMGILLYAFRTPLLAASASTSGKESSVTGEASIAAPAGDEEEYPALEVILRDSRWRKILIRKGSIYRTTENLIMEIPWEALEKETIYEFELSGRTEAGEELRYSFSCAYKD